MNSILSFFSRALPSDEGGMALIWRSCTAFRGVHLLLPFVLSLPGFPSRPRQGFFSLAVPPAGVGVLGKIDAQRKSSATEITGNVVAVKYRISLVLSFYLDLEYSVLVGAFSRQNLFFGQP